MGCCLVVSRRLMVRHRTGMRSRGRRLGDGLVSSCGRRPGGDRCRGFGLRGSLTGALGGLRRGGYHGHMG